VSNIFANEDDDEFLFEDDVQSKDSQDVSVAEEPLYDDFESIVEDMSEDDDSSSEKSDKDKQKNAIKNSGDKSSSKSKNQKTTKENEMLKMKNVRLDVMRPFFGENFK
jgi:hypothetical protein